MQTPESRIVTKMLFGSLDTEKKVERLAFDNFFVIERGKARDLGNQRPTGLNRIPGEPRFALVQEDRRAGTKDVKFLGPVSRAAAFETAMGLAETEQDPRLRIIVGRSIGRRSDGKVVYEDVAGFRFVEGSHHTPEERDDEDE